MSKKILDIFPLSSHFKAKDPFLFCVHHHDLYPPGNDELGPDAPLTGRNIGNDFISKDGWNMYHGSRVPGFPEHPHYGFETVTIVLEGVIDHFDSTHSTGRFGAGDVQWMTAGTGARHSEMFPLINKDQENPLELFQIWLNLPQKDKKCDPHYKMLWTEDIPLLESINNNQSKSNIQVISGIYNGVKSLSPSPASWANDAKNYVNILLIHLEPNANFTLPPLSDTLNRTLYFYRGDTCMIDDTRISSSSGIELAGDCEINVKNGDTDSYLLLLEGEPIGEPVVTHGPFVGNTEDDIIEIYDTYRATGFGQWPWKDTEPVHPRHQGRFAKYADGNTEFKD